MKLLKDRYKLLEKIDEDEKVALFLGQTVKEPVANIDIRIVKARFMQKPEFIQRYTQEFQAMAKLDSPLFMKVFDIDFFNNLFFVASEHVEGKNLNTLIKEKTPLTLAQIINIITQLTRAFGIALKENIKYRSLTYEDIVMLDNGKLKILQFHIPRNNTANPEDCSKIQSPSSDIFFIGCLFYEMMSFESIFSLDATVKKIRTIKDFSLDVKRHGIKPAQIEKIKELIYRCITGDITSRYQTIDEVLTALNKFVQDQINTTDVLTTMQVDPGKFKTSETKTQARTKTGPVSVPSILSAGIKNLGTEQAANNSEIPQIISVNQEEAAAGHSEKEQSLKKDADPYDIIFSKKPVNEMMGEIKAKPRKTGAAAPKGKSLSESLEAGINEKNTAAKEKNSSNYITPETSFTDKNLSGENFGAECGSNIEESGIKNTDLFDAEDNAGERRQSGETNKAMKNGTGDAEGVMWKNKKSSGGIFAKIANFWYTMMFVLIGFLSFALYIFW